MKYNNLKKSFRNTDPFVIKKGLLKDSKIDTVYRSDWSEDTYISEAGQKEKMKNGFEVKRLFFLKFFLIFFMSLLLAKTAWLQIVNGEYYYSKAEGNRVRVERIEPKRGVIYDREMRPLVRNEANFILYVVPVDLPEIEELELILERICRLVPDIDKQRIKEKIAVVDKYSLEAYLPIFISDNIDYDSAMVLYLEASNWPGIILTNKTNRDYLRYTFVDSKNSEAFNSLSHIIGYTGKINNEELTKFGDEYLAIDYIGKMGIEYFWENELKGVNGKKEIEVDALGKEKKIISETEAQDGHNLLLSLDIHQQTKLEEIMLEALVELNLSRAIGIVMDPNNGEILAMVSLPAFDNNKFAQGIKSQEYNELISQVDRPLFNRAISGEYPSGSTFKPIVAAAALEERVVSENTIFLSVGGISIGQWYFPDWKAGGHGRVNVRSAIANSVNTYFYYVGGGYDDFIGLGVDRIVKYAELFGLGSQTGIDLAGERSGFVPTKAWKEEVKNERWYIGDTYHISIGQGDLLVTPLQVAAFTSVFANGGKLYRPHFVKLILSGNDVPLSQTEIVPIREDFIDSYNIMVVRKGMKDTIDYGSASSMQTVGVEIAGKTGTAQWSSKKENHAWFTGFAPFDNPELVITILIEEGGEGSSVAVPVAREYLDWYFNEYK
jgi:penicillin-binding protein 2